eukprot:TRINITY_DN1662_c0_g1_i5.p1 TRINITY_DN1662_c0_g1~~TRINITY_DN1662_c0_g1_i5.p1  ORF type:complete len:361 (-),score=85.95 TRINITY_DN1662_c0_g1_i5:587-1507(-)
MAFVPSVGVGSAGSRLRPLPTRRSLWSRSSPHPLVPTALGVPARVPLQAMAAGGGAPASPPPPPPPLGRRALLARLAAAAAGVAAAVATADTLGDAPRASAAPAVGPTATNASKDGSSTPETGFVTKSGLRYFDFAVGSGDRRPAWGDLLTVSYVLYTVSPEGDRLDVADSTYARKQHMLVHHGNGQTILGMEEALHGMRAGGRRRVVIPPSLGYTNSGLGPVPPRTTTRRALNRTLNEGNGLVVIDLELVAVRPDPNDTGLYTDLTPAPDDLAALWEKGRADTAAAAAAAIKVSPHRRSSCCGPG